MSRNLAEGFYWGYCSGCHIRTKNSKNSLKGFNKLRKLRWNKLGARNREHYIKLANVNKEKV